MSTSPTQNHDDNATTNHQSRNCIFPTCSSRKGGNDGGSSIQGGEWISSPSVAAESNQSISVNNKSPLNEFLDEASIEGLNLNLVLHSKHAFTSNNNNSTALVRPTPITVFIKISDANENSSMLSPGDSCGQPSLVWDTEYSSNTKRDSDGIRSQGVISLFDIQSIQKANVMNLKSYPYAIAGNSLLITMENTKCDFGDSTSELVLEVQTDEGAKKIMHGLRRVIARLSYHLITGNAEVCSELLMKTNHMRSFYDGGGGRSVNTSFSNGDNFNNNNHERMNGFTHQLMEKSILKVKVQQKKQEIFFI